MRVSVVARVLVDECMVLSYPFAMGQSERDRVSAGKPTVAVLQFSVFSTE